MKYLFTIMWLLTFSGMLYLFAIMPAPKRIQPPDGVNVQLWNKGRVMYGARCTSCHNSNPDLAGPVGPRLRGVTEELLRERLKNGKGGMPAQPNMLRFVPALREFLK